METYRSLKLRFFEVDLTGTYFDNEVLGSAAAAMVAVSEACRLPPKAVEASARTFKPLPRRIETAAKINGGWFSDDSKATNLAGMCAAIRISSRPVHLIAGGDLKETNLSFVKDLLAQQVSQLYLIGEASEMMQAAWGDSLACYSCETLEEAVSAEWGCAVPGDTVLLSQACNSLDQFGSFGERGEVFVREVFRLKSGCA